MPHNWVVEGNDVLLWSFYTTGASEEVDTMTGLTSLVYVLTRVSNTFETENNLQSECLLIGLGSEEKWKETYTQRLKHINNTKQFRLGNQWNG